ncbi:MAG: oxygen-independent coproporphyrinogen III oxidase [Bacteriovorax sp.]|nr:oxygen-independent coproporphyrinogen III oxidase [Bacteriovorax sp.]
MENVVDLVEKYNRPAPRYTSYPPVPYWSDAPDEVSWINHVKQAYDPKRGVDLYVHIPFCESLCYYCGCNRTITKNHALELTYLDMVLKEWSLYVSKLGFTPMVNSLHFGGGTPTFLSGENLAILISTLLKKKGSQFVGSIEIDPRTVKDEHYEVLNRFGMTRVSLGIQDFNPDVQRAINRFQSPDLIKKMVERLRSMNFQSINFDLIYGLPNQTVQTIQETFELVSDLRPDLIAFYSYAHLPDKIKNQKLIKNDQLPNAKNKRELYLTGKKLLEEKGYVEIGMDHFALPGSFLHTAMVGKNLHRNFMGYVDKKSNVLIGLGPTSISDSSLSFAQNAKDNNTYERLLSQGHLPISSGHTHSNEDLLVQELIQQLMCQQEMSLENVDSVPFWKDIQDELKEFQKDGILDFDEGKIIIQPNGKGFVRNVALSFDFHYRTKVTSAKFSQSI